MAVIAKQRYKLDIAPKGGWVIVYASQHDNAAREIEFEITNQGRAFSIPASINVSVQGVKSNECYFSHSCSYSGNVVTMVLADDMTDVIGKAICVLKFTNSSQQKLATAKFILNVDSDSSSEGIIIDTEAKEIFNQMLDEIRAQAASISADIAELQSMVGSPLVASTVSAMTDHNKIYVYTGNETGYTYGNWYYWNGTAWASGGVYNAVAFQTDDTLSVSGMAADSASTGNKKVNRPLSDGSPVNGTYGQFLQTNGDGTTQWVDIEQVIVDPTLTQEEQAADAKAVGDLINNAVFKTGTGQVTEQNTTFFTLSDNIYNYKTALSGKRLSSDGGLIDSSAYVTSDYIDVSKIDYITGYRHNGSTLTTPTLEYAMYDSDFSVISARSGKSGSVDVRGVSYIRFDGTDSIKNQYMIVDSSKTVTSYIPYETTFKYASDNVIHLTTADDLIQSLIDNAGSTFVFDNGNYDVIAIYESKYGSDYFTNYAGYSTNNVADRGLPVLRGTKIKCSQGAVFTCNYTGSNTSVRNNFSAFAIESSVEINGLRLTASGIRNCIHDDFDNFYMGTTPTIIKNCILEHDRMVIAGGLAQHDIVIIENCIFNDTFVNHVSDFYYHNNLNGDAQSLMIIKDCYLNKGVGIKYYGSSTKMTNVIITNCSMANEIDFGANSGATVVNMRVLDWNNKVRS